MSNAIAISSYVPDQEPFKNYLDRLKAQLSVLKVKDDQRQKYLIAYIGSEAYSQLKDACLPSHPTEKTFEDLVTYLDAIYSPLRLVVSDRLNLINVVKVRGNRYKNLSLR